MRWCLVLLVTLWSQSRPMAAHVTPFVLGEQGGVAVTVMLNGQGPFTLMLDTGSTGSAIADDVAARILAPVVAQGEVSSAAGVRMRPIVRIETLTLGPASTAVDATLVSRRELNTVTTADGLIGQDVLSALRYTIDFDRREIVWHGDEGLAPGGMAVDLALQDGRFLVELPQKTGVLRLVPDSGAGGLVLFRDAGRTLPAMTGRLGGVGVTTLEGRVDANAVSVHELRIGATLHRNVPAVVVNRQTTPATGDGLLPLHFFRRVTFDGPARRLIVG